MTHERIIPPADVLNRIPDAVRPRGLPRGYFDAMVKPTRELLDRGLNVGHAADWWVAQGVLPPRFRRKFMEAMRARLSRLRQVQRVREAHLVWKSSPYHVSVHAVGEGVRALCGAKAIPWMEATSTSVKCDRCVGVARRLSVEVREE